jgi:hypothetical protein
VTEIRHAQADNPFLTAVLSALKRRSKALKHRNAVPTVERIVEIRDGVTLERIEIVMRVRRRQSLTVLAWDDRSIWIHACEAIKNTGWRFQFTDSGRLSGHQMRTTS